MQSKAGKTVGLNFTGGEGLEKVLPTWGKL